MMHYLRPAIGNVFEVVDQQGRVLATGTLQLELKTGAQRHGGVTFVSDEPTEAAPLLSDQPDVLQMLADAQAGR